MIIDDITTAWITPDWPAPRSVRACSTTRTGGFSHGDFAGLNLSDRVGDDPQAVAKNRELLRRALALPDEPYWLAQVHGAGVVGAAARREGHGVGAAVPCADASYASAPGVVCVVLTADCLPVLLADRRGGHVGAVHAGWRGLAADVIGAAVAAMGVTPQSLLAWLGPAIGPDVFEVGEDVRAALLATDPSMSAAFRAGEHGRWFADIYALARGQLAARGVTEIYGGHWCTVTERQRFYSYRRDGQTGRMATLVWMTE